MEATSQIPEIYLKALLPQIVAASLCLLWVSLAKQI